MITEDYVSFETSKLMKEKGFDLSDFHGKWAIDYDNILHDENNTEVKIIITEWHYPLITLQMAMKWLREVYEIIPIVLTGGDSQNPFYYWFRIDTTKEGKWEDSIYREDEKEFSTYEQACEAAIKYCLENLI